MNVSRMMRNFLVLFAATSLVECGGSGASHSIPTSGVTSAHRGHAMGLGTISGCGEYPDGSVAALDRRARKIYFYEGPLTNSSTPTATITLPGTSTYDPTGGMTFDPSGDLWVTYAGSGGSAIYEFAAPLTTGEAPSISITGSNTRLIAPWGISYNSATGNIYVADSAAGAVYVWSSSASGNVAPSSTISGSSTTLANPVGIKTDANYIYVNSGSGGVAIFNLTDSGNVPPQNTITTSTGVWFDFDTARNFYSAPGSNVNAYIPFGGYVTEVSATTTNALETIAVDDGGYIYGTPGTNLAVFSPMNWSNETVTAVATISLGSSAIPGSIALYSPGKFNGTEPQ